MAYEEQCGGCTFYDFQGDNSRGYCSWYGSYYYPGDSCDHQRPRGYYIATAICEKLGFDYDCSVLNTIRFFRDNVMQKDCKYCKTLFEYDVVGPKIADMIKEDKDTDQEMWHAIYNFYLSQTANLVQIGKHDEAVTRYSEMIIALKKHYGLKEDIVEITNNYNKAQDSIGKIQMLQMKKF